MGNKLAWLLCDLWDGGKRWLCIFGRFVRHAPLVKCPLCEGAGGRMSGYYEPEWEECWYCWLGWRWFTFEDDGLQRCVGRVHPLRWPRAVLCLKTGHTSFVGFLACKLRLHARDEYGFCRRCFAPFGDVDDKPKKGEGR